MRTRQVAIELFAGAGGLALGIEQAGFSVRAAVDIDKYCCQTLRYNAPKYLPQATVLRRDIRRLRADLLLRLAHLSRDEVGLISGGPPCQSFSLSAIPKGGRSPNDPRDRLLWHFARIVRAIKPRAFVFENVLGLFSKNGGSSFVHFRLSLERVGYLITYGVLDSFHYGVPQTRRRLFLLGCLSSPPELPTSVNLPSNGGSSKSIGEVLSKLSPDMPNNCLPTHTLRKHAMLAQIPPGSVWKHWRHRDAWNGPSRCITGHCRDEWVHPLEPRAGTVRELAALQTFPADYVFRGPLSLPHNHELTSQYRQVGNAVPVQLAKVIGEAILRLL